MLVADFRFRVVDRHGQESRLIYRTDPASLEDAEGNRVPLDPIGKEYLYWEWPKRPSFTPEKPIGKSRRATRLKIQLGLGCNMACSYCSQGNQRTRGARTGTKDAEHFLAQLDSWLEGEPTHIELWGGEPLIYWKKIAILAPALRERFPNATMSIITNGTLLTKKKTEFLARHFIKVTVSHDGPGQALRGPDPFDNPTKRREIKRLFDTIGHNATFNVVMTAKNSDIGAILRFFAEKMGRSVLVNVEDPVSAYAGMANARFDSADLSRMRANVTAQILDKTALDVPAILNKLKTFFNGLVGAVPLDSAGQWCNMDAEDFIAVDLAGNVLTCQNVGAKDHSIGHVWDFEGIRLDTSWHFSEREHCMTCPVVHLCYGTCMFLTGREFDVSCENSYHYNLAIIYAAIELLTNKKVLGIEYHKPKRFIPIRQAQ